VDRLAGGAGADTLQGGQRTGSPDRFIGGAGADLLQADFKRAMVRGEGGDDRIEAPRGAVSITGGRGDDRIETKAGGPEAHGVTCGAGTDLIGGLAPRTLVPPDCEQFLSDVAGETVFSARVALRGRRLIVGVPLCFTPGCRVKIAAAAGGEELGSVEAAPGPHGRRVGIRLSRAERRTAARAKRIRLTVDPGFETMVSYTVSGPRG
jgi:hypothetical protein